MVSARSIAAERVLEGTAEVGAGVALAPLGALRLLDREAFDLWLWSAPDDAVQAVAGFADVRRHDAVVLPERFLLPHRAEVARLALTRALSEAAEPRSREPLRAALDLVDTRLDLLRFLLARAEAQMRARVTHPQHLVVRPTARKRRVDPSIVDALAAGVPPGRGARQALRKLCATPIALRACDPLGEAIGAALLEEATARVRDPKRGRPELVATLLRHAQAGPESLAEATLALLAAAAQQGRGTDSVRRLSTFTQDHAESTPKLALAVLLRAFVEWAEGPRYAERCERDAVAAAEGRALGWVGALNEVWIVREDGAWRCVERGPQPEAKAAASDAAPSLELLRQRAYTRWSHLDLAEPISEDDGVPRAIVRDLNRAGIHSYAEVLRWSTAELRAGDVLSPGRQLRLLQALDALLSRPPHARGEHGTLLATY